MSSRENQILLKNACFFFQSDEENAILNASINQSETNGDEYTIKFGLTVNKKDNLEHIEKGKHHINNLKYNSYEDAMKDFGVKTRDVLQMIKDDEDGLFEGIEYGSLESTGLVSEQEILKLSEYYGEAVKINAGSGHVKDFFQHIELNTKKMNIINKIKDSFGSNHKHPDKLPNPKKLLKFLQAISDKKNRTSIEDIEKLAEELNSNSYGEFGVRVIKDDDFGNQKKDINFENFTPQDLIKIKKPESLVDSMSQKIEDNKEKEDLKKELFKMFDTYTVEQIKGVLPTTKETIQDFESKYGKETVDSFINELKQREKNENSK